MIERSFSKITGFIDGIFPQEAVSLEELERILEKILEYMARNSAIMKIMQRESLDCTNVGIAEIFQKYFKPLYRKGIRFSQAGKKGGVFKEEMHARQFIISLYTLIMSYYNDGAMISLLLGEDVLFNVYCGPRILPREKRALENLAAYLIRSSLSQQRMEYRPEEAKVTYCSKDRKEKKSCDALEWLAAMGSHVP